MAHWVVLLVLWFSVHGSSVKRHARILCGTLGVDQTRMDLAFRWPKQISKRERQSPIQIWIRINIQWVPSCKCMNGSSRGILPVVVLLGQYMEVTWYGRNVQFEV